MAQLADIIAALEQAYPPALAESWDRVGLVAGDPEAEVHTVAVAVDCTDAVVDDALAAGAQLLLVHHPPLLRPTDTVATTHPKGRLLHKLITAGCALYAAHTNADSARPGVNDALCETLGLTPRAPLVPQAVALDKWIVTCPPEQMDEVLDAVFAAGAGEFGGYSGCAFTHTGRGQFKPEDGTNPTIGTVGEVERLAETHAEFIAPRNLREKVRTALLRAHPYEVPAYDVLESDAGSNTGDNGAKAAGLGRICTLDKPRTLRELTHDFAARLPRTVGGLRAAGDPDMLVHTIAVCSGAGDAHLSDARRVGADVYVTGDLRHHPVDEHLRLGPPAVIDVPHWAAEFPWCAQAAGILSVATGVDTTVIERSTDPWTVHAGGPTDNTRGEGRH